MASSSASVWGDTLSDEGFGQVRCYSGVGIWGFGDEDRVPNRTNRRQRDESSRLTELVVFVQGLLLTNLESLSPGRSEIFVGHVVVE